MAAGKGDSDLNPFVWLWILRHPDFQVLIYSIYFDLTLDGVFFQA